MAVQKKAQAGSEGSGPPGSPSREGSPTERQGEKAEGTEEPRALHTSAGKNSDSRCTKRLSSPPGPSLRGHFINLVTGTPRPCTLPVQAAAAGAGRACQLRLCVPEATLRLLLGWQPPSAEVSLCLLYRFIIASHRVGRNRGERGRESGRQRQGARGSEKEAGGGKESFKLRREMEANF